METSADDLIVGAYYSDANGSNAGSSYVVFGNASGFDAGFELSNLDGRSGNDTLTLSPLELLKLSDSHQYVDSRWQFRRSRH